MSEDGPELFGKDAGDENEKEEDPVIPHRIFMNHVDGYHARHIAEYLTDQVYGALKAAGGDEMGEEEMDEEPKQQTPSPALLGGNKYEIIGTMKNKFGQKTEDIAYTISESDVELYLQEILKCGFAVFDITQDEGEIPKALAVLSAFENEVDQVKEIGPKTLKKYDRTFVFILITNVLSWAKTKPIDPDDPEAAFTEADYKKRKPHPNYLDQIACEREVVLKGRKYKDKLKTYVICSGITYGFEEEDLFFLFKMAWNNEKYLPLFLPGNNIIPLVHVQDLAKVLHALIENIPKKPQFLLAVEQTPCKLKQIIRALSKAMGRGRVKEVTKEEAFLYNGLTQKLYDRYTLGLNMEPSFIVDDLGVEFRNDLNLAENMKKIVAEFRTSRNLNPKRIIIHGPPASGKTTLAKKISEYYGVHYVSVKTMIDETIEELRGLIDEEIAYRKEKAEKPPQEDEENIDEGGEEAEEDTNDLEGWQEKLRDIETTLENSENGKLPDEYVVRLMKSFLASNICQNQGYVLDGFPKDMTQVKELFGAESEAAGEEEGGEEEGEGEPAMKTNILPTFVLSLEATDDFLCERAMNMQEKDVQGTHYTEEAMLSRLKTFRANNTEDNTILNFFDEKEIHPIIINIMEQDSLNVEAIFEKTKEKLGLPIGFALTPEEQEELLRCQEEADKLREEERRIERELLEREALEDYQNKMEEKIKLLEELQLEEEKLLVVQCEPLRSYLMKYIFPTLTQGLLEIARVKPEDPIDYLAEYLFKVNPEGRMFDPMYTRQGELIEKISKQIIIDKTKKRVDPCTGFLRVARK